MKRFESAGWARRRSLRRLHRWHHQHRHPIGRKRLFRPVLDALHRPGPGVEQRLACAAGAEPGARPISRSLKSLKDYTVQMGGPIKKDKAFFYASTQRYSDRTDPTVAGGQPHRHQPAPEREVHVAAAGERHPSAEHAVQQLQRHRTRRHLAVDQAADHDQAVRNRAGMGVERAVAAHLQLKHAWPKSTGRGISAATTTSIRLTPSPYTLDGATNTSSAATRRSGSSPNHTAIRCRPHYDKVRPARRHALVQVRRRDRAQPRPQPVPAVQARRASASYRYRRCASVAYASAMVMTFRVTATA